MAAQASKNYIKMYMTIFMAAQAAKNYTYMRASHLCVLPKSTVPAQFTSRKKAVRGVYVS